MLHTFQQFTFLYESESDNQDVEDDIYPTGSVKYNE